MGLFVADDPHYDPSVRQTGFNRYRQLLGDRFGAWWKINLLTLLGFAPLAAGIFYAVNASSILVLIPCSLAGGLIAGPFLSGLYDAILRGMRDDFQNWWKAYRRAWRQNWRGSLVPGALFGLMLGLFAFMGMLFWWAQTPPTGGTVAVYFSAMLLTLILQTLYWPQLVLFEQKPVVRLRNCVLFCIRYFWHVLGAGLMQLAYWAVYVLFAPWTLILLPIIGIWYILFLTLHLLYRDMNEAFHIEPPQAQRTEEA